MEFPPDSTMSRQAVRMFGTITRTLLRALHKMRFTEATRRLFLNRSAWSKPANCENMFARIKLNSSTPETVTLTHNCPASVTIARRGRGHLAAALSVGEPRALTEDNFRALDEITGGR